MLAADFADQLALPPCRYPRLRAVRPRDQGRGFCRAMERDHPPDRSTICSPSSPMNRPARSPASPHAPKTAAETDLELLLLPLAHVGHARIRALGVLAPMATPYWIGAKPVAELDARHAAPYRRRHRKSSGPASGAGGRRRPGCGTASWSIAAAAKRLPASGPANAPLTIDA